MHRAPKGANENSPARREASAGKGKKQTKSRQGRLKTHYNRRSQPCRFREFSPDKNNHVIPTSVKRNARFLQRVSRGPRRALGRKQDGGTLCLVSPNVPHRLHPRTNANVFPSPPGNISAYSTG